MVATSNVRTKSFISFGPFPRSVSFQHGSHSIVAERATLLSVPASYSNSVRMFGTVASQPGGNVTGITPHVAGLSPSCWGWRGGRQLMMRCTNCGIGNATVSINVDKGTTIVSDSRSQGGGCWDASLPRPGNGWLGLGMEP